LPPQEAPLIDAVPVALQLDNAIVQRGLAAVLPEHGCRLEPTPGATGVLLLDSLDRALAAAARRPAPRIVLVIDAAATLAVYRDALAVGITAVVRQDTDPADLARTIADAHRGHTRLPHDVAVQLAVAAQGSGEHVTPRERDWLRGLAAGHTVAQVAEASGYAERSMFRLLDDLYGRLGVSHRSEAIALAARRGWLDG
jgi:DNA-binding NarL/FixJ family response regulator